MSKKHQEEEGKENSERWLLTYSDMITLLLALFIMLYTMSSIDAKKYNELSGQLNTQLNPSKAAAQETTAGETVKGLSGSFTILGSSASAQLAQNALKPVQVKVTDLQQELADLIQDNNLNAYASVHEEERGIVISMVEGMLFDSGSATINGEANAILNELVQVANSVDNYIRIEGSTDNVPIHTAQFPTNWELAAARAINVAKVLVAQGVDPSRVSAVSYGEYRPIAPNDTEENKRLNRRVDIVFLDAKLDMSEAGMEDDKPANEKAADQPTAG